MSVERPLTDLDADLRALLAIEPSPEFAARVRSRVAGERMAGWGWTPWLLVASTACGVGLAIVLAWPSAGVQAPEPPAAPRLALGEAALPALPGVPELPPAPRRAAATPSESPRVFPPVAVAEVLVDPRQRTAVDALLALTNRGAVLEFVPAPNPVAAEIVVDPLNVPVLTVDPLPGTPGAEKE
jgi:hypothetical protein